MATGADLLCRCSDARQLPVHAPLDDGSYLGAIAPSGVGRSQRLRDFRFLAQAPCRPVLRAISSTRGRNWRPTLLIGAEASLMELVLVSWVISCPLMLHSRPLRTDLCPLRCEHGHAHQPGDAVVAGRDAEIGEFGADARRAVGRVAGLVDLADALHQLGVGLRPGAGRAISPVVVAAGGHAQHSAQRAHGEFGLVRLHEFEDVVDVRSLLTANQAVAFARMSRSICTCFRRRRNSTSSCLSAADKGVCSLAREMAGGVSPSARWIQIRMAFARTPNSRDSCFRAPRHFVRKATITGTGGVRALWAFGQAAFEPVQMSIGPSLPG